MIQPIHTLAVWLLIMSQLSEGSFYHFQKNIKYLVIFVRAEKLYNWADYLVTTEQAITKSSNTCNYLRPQIARRTRFSCPLSKAHHAVVRQSANISIIISWLGLWKKQAQESPLSCQGFAIVWRDTLGVKRLLYLIGKARFAIFLSVSVRGNCTGFTSFHDF